MNLEGQPEKAMGVQMHHPARHRRANKHSRYPVALPVARGRANALEMFPERLDDQAEYERIIRDFVSMHDAVFAADQYNS
jgi:hypothetical protein